MLQYLDLSVSTRLRSRAEKIFCILEDCVYVLCLLANVGWPAHVASKQENNLRIGSRPSGEEHMVRKEENKGSH